MKKLTLILCLISTISKAQITCFVGVNGAYMHNTIHNKEDKSAPNGMLVQKGKLAPSYGLQVGLHLGKHWEISLAPNYQNFKTSYSGKSDTAIYRDFTSSISLRYLNIPLQVAYNAALTEKVGYFIGANFNVGFLRNYHLNLEGQQKSGNSLYNVSADIENKNSFYKSISSSGNVLELKYSSDKLNYKSINYSIGLNSGIKYKLNEKLTSIASIQAYIGLTDIENKVLVKSHVENGALSYDFETLAWKENSYYSYYQRPVSEYNKRPASTTLSIGFGLGIQYNLGKSNSSSNNNY